MSEPTSNLPPFNGLDEFEQFLRGVSEPGAKAEASSNSRQRRPITALRVPLIAAVRAEVKKAAAPVEKRPPPVQVLFDAPPPAPAKPPLNDNKLMPRPFTGLPSMTSLDPMSQAPDFGYLPPEPEIVGSAAAPVKDVAPAKVAAALLPVAAAAELLDPPPPEFGELAGFGLGDPLQFGKAALELEESYADRVVTAEAEPRTVCVELEAQHQAQPEPVRVAVADSEPDAEAVSATADVAPAHTDLLLLPAPAPATLPAVIPPADETLGEPPAEVIPRAPVAIVLPDLSAAADALDLNAIVALSIASAVRDAEPRPNQRPVLPAAPRLPLPPENVRVRRPTTAKTPRSQTDGRGRAQLAAVAILSVGVVSATAIFYESGISSNLRNPFASSTDLASVHHAASGAAQAAPLPVAAASIAPAPQTSPVSVAALPADPTVAIATLAAANLPLLSGATSRIAFDAARFSSGSGIDAIAAQLPGMDPGDGAAAAGGDLFDDGGSSSPRSFPESAAAVAQQKAQAAKYGLGAPAAAALSSVPPAVAPPASPPVATVQIARPVTQPLPSVQTARALPVQAANAAAAPSAKAPVVRRVVLDASEGTPIDPLLNKTWDLNYPKTVPNMK